MGIENFLAFLLTALFFVMTPGLDTVFILNKSITQGRKAGFYASLGINSGVLVHTVFAALGLSILIAQSAMAFSLIKYLGAAYLIYLGISNFISKKEKSMGKPSVVGKPSKKQSFIAGLVTNTFNPKVALFFLAFFPQFINPNELNNPIPFVFLGVSYAIIGIVWCLTLTYFSGTFSKKLMANPKANGWIDIIAGVVFIAMGLTVALDKS